ncbi:hypothetical protein IFM89_008668 [Coptis chinensis]|uniref:RING-type E3 ubiquitin transferase n=1 Tax=Coptis chinensis TaxID=261450 RepID=A0A835GVF4_9MAGN|nr:hypothetical protein IFM89_008668 [Coptis chinensis]
MATPQFPDDFKCPISLEIMTDPVILSSGHTFDRSSIQRWIDSGNRICPLTKQTIPQNFTLIPNHALRSLISNYTLCSPQQNPEPQTLVSTLSSKTSSFESKLDSLSQLNRLCKKSPVFRQRVMEYGAVSAVLSCVGSENASLKELALALLLNLSLDDDNKVGLVAEGAIGRVVGALRGGNSSCRAYAATMLTSLAMVEVNKGTIGAYPFAIRTLVSLLRDGKAREKKEAATALYVLCSFPDNKKRVVESGAVPILIEMADSGVERAVEVLGLLAKCWEGREEMGRVDGCVPILVQVLRNGSSRSVVNALSTMNSLCCYDEEVGLDVMRQGGLEICLGLVEDENEKISGNASALIQTLRRYRLRG